MQRAGRLESGHTEVLLGVAPAFALLVQLTLWAVLEGVVAVSYNDMVSNRPARTHWKYVPISLKK